MYVTGTLVIYESRAATTVVADAMVALIKRNTATLRSFAATVGATAEYMALAECTNLNHGQCHTMTITPAFACIEIMCIADAFGTNQHT